eukprot:TRINITY_DN4008_c0_g1_i5.p1 TRINITY_DN4008_c0_g1~~TRINITY_DN4008_c0_g1_i5.p1  ORF type:complete len:435 (+),score=88.69 TRINITY_DN4008_c0_g1_i5:67-1371(+)
MDDPKTPFGSTVPFAEPAWYQGKSSPYYNEHHVRWRAKVRNFVEEEIMPHWKLWDEAREFPTDLYKKAYDAGVYSWSYPQELGGTPPCEKSNMDYFFHLIFQDEMARVPAGGIQASLFCHGIALPPLLSFGSQYIKDTYAAPVIQAKMIACLAITEPFAGSDVANIRTVAVRKGDFYFVSGSKKFITGVRKQNSRGVGDGDGLPTVLTTAVRTGEGRTGISLLVIEADSPGVKITRLETQGWWSSHTTLITFDEVQVPVRNLVGRENEGFLPIMLNFNSERFGLCAMANRAARTCLSEAISYARKRKTFGKNLISHDLIRWKMVEMIRRVEGNHAWLEQIAFQMNSVANSTKPTASFNATITTIGASLALCKISCTETVEMAAREASQIFGGASYLRSGLGEKVESIYRDVRVLSIGGGSAEVMGLLATKLARL